MRSFIKRLVGERFVSFYRGYSVIPGVLVQELRRMLGMVRSRRRYADDLEVLLCQLRTSAHIVDKGLQTDTWKPAHGRAAYETLCRYVACLEDTTLSTDPSYRWAVEKKAEYEEAQKSGVPKRHLTECPPAKIATRDLVHLIQSRRSVRSFEARFIDLAILRELADVINWSPTSCNRQPTRLFITQNPEKVCICLKQCAGATCIGEVPCFIAVCADSRFYTAQDRNLPFIDVSLGLQNMLLTAHLQGIEGTLLNWMHHTSKEDRTLRETLAIPEYYLVIMNLVLGYPTAVPPAPRRKGNDLTFVLVD